MAAQDLIIEIQRQLADLHSVAGRTEGKIDTFIAQLATQDERATKLEVRVRKVEGRQHWLAGAAAAGAVLLDKFLPGFFPHST
jgi:hypothetical protein